MSHLKERKEKDCLNCGAIVEGRFCQVCGQENIEPKESFWHLVTHFMYDVTHFDGKFFSTLKYLLFKPGYLSHEYLRGKRASYLHPIRMYVFTSAFFFLCFFSLQKNEDTVEEVKGKTTAASVIKKLEDKKETLKENLEDSMPGLARSLILKQIAEYDSNIALIKRDTTTKDSIRLYTNSAIKINASPSINEVTYKTIGAYDSAQNKLPIAKRDNFLKRKLARQNIHLRQKYHADNKAIIKAIFEKFLHMLPQTLFVSLPLFAFILQLLYIRRKKFYYVNHVVHTIHLYCATFIIILISLLTGHLFDQVHVEEPGWVSGIFVLLIFFYLYKTLRNFYEQSRGKTIAKFLLLLFISLFVMIFLFSLFFFFSAMSI